MSDIRPYNDAARRSCIQVERGTDTVKFVPLDVENGLAVHECPKREFDDRFKPMADYPADKAVRLFVTYAQSIGATQEVMEYFSRIIKITEREIKMATTKKSAAVERVEKVTAKKTTLAAAVKAEKEQTAKTEGKPAPTTKRSGTKTSLPFEPDKTAPTKANDKAKASLAVKPESVKPKTAPAAKAKPAEKPTTLKKGPSKAVNAEYKSASKMFEALVLEQVLTDDEIFAAVQKKFGLDEKKRSYVGWWKSHLRREGKLQ